MTKASQGRRALPDLNALFATLQSDLLERLTGHRQILGHPGTLGAATEKRWTNTLSTHLPKRYQVSSAFAIDSLGRCSEQIDVLIYDRQYSPFLLHQDGATFVPAESVYAVLEVKQTLSRDDIRYAGDKAASVRRLSRYSTQTPHAGGVFKPQNPKPILAGILATESTWKPPFGEPLRHSLAALPVDSRLDLGCALLHGAFEVTNQDDEPTIETSGPSMALMSFLLSLQQRLQALGTVATMDLGRYRAVLSADDERTSPP